MNTLNLKYLMNSTVMTSFLEVRETIHSGGMVVTTHFQVVTALMSYMGVVEVIF